MTNIIDELPSITVIKNATILPIKYRSSTYEWGLGGVLDSGQNYVETSGMQYPSRFGGKYEYDIQKRGYLNETIIYIGPLKTHWGHFLIDCSTRLWYEISEKTDLRIAYCGFEHESNQLPQECIEFFELIGIERNRLIDIREPILVKKVIIPEQAFVPGYYCYKCYLDIFDEAVKNVEISKYKKTDKLYFTRTKLSTSKEIGEKFIERVFAKNGFEVVAPETISVSEQIALVNQCKQFVSLEGTIAHNIIFARNIENHIILRKHKYKNSRQYLIND